MQTSLWPISLYLVQVWFKCKILYGVVCVPFHHALESCLSASTQNPPSLPLRFYTAFIMFYTNFLIAPAVAGLAVYGLLYIQRRPETMVTTAKDQLKYRKFYDHPLAFAYAGFLILWGSLMVRNWIVKQKELAYRWKVDDSFFDAHTPNPQSTAKVQHLFINGRWEYKAVETLSQYRRKLAFVAGVTAPVFVLFIGLVLGCQYLCIRIIMWEDKHTSLFYDYGTGNERRNPKGFAALYFATALSATFVWLLNWLWGKVVLPLNNAENHPTSELMEGPHHSVHSYSA